MSHCALIPY